MLFKTLQITSFGYLTTGNCIDIHFRKVKIFRILSFLLFVNFFVTEVHVIVVMF